ncbi:hypothetical protein FHS85_001742 [Rhodoligotrophos appendicifer]|uniref:hypothetical protein n=1 Tax=Rhodoligotrophos appendicifer TaxID=987056 RepID=UPI0011851984|nr:hypothetical protein [Rhodoligotrophos appendicifer]
MRKLMKDGQEIADGSEIGRKGELVIRLIQVFQDRDHILVDYEASYGTSSRKCLPSAVGGEIVDD